MLPRANTSREVVEHRRRYDSPRVREYSVRATGFEGLGGVGAVDCL